jgi:hypothetical protein
MNGQPLAGLTDTFDLTVSGNGLPSKCADATITKESSAYDEFLAFQLDEDYMDVQVDSTLESTASVNGCDPAYKLYAFSPYPAPNDGWMTWDKLVA